MKKETILLGICAFICPFVMLYCLRIDFPTTQENVEDKITDKPITIILEGSYDNKTWYSIPTDDIANKIVQDTVINGKKYNYIMSKIGIND